MMAWWTSPTLLPGLVGGRSPPSTRSKSSLSTTRCRPARVNGARCYRLYPERAEGPVDPRGLRRSRYHLSRERAAGYRDALKHHKATADTLRIYQVSANTPEAGAGAARGLLTEPSGPTAILTDSDQLALGVLRAGTRARRDSAPPAVGRRHRRHPRRRPHHTPLATVQQLFVDKGREAARLLIAGETAATILLAVRLIERSSTAPPEP